jgi:plastocyanin domain-containing protein
MPCGPLQAMQLYALSTGNPFEGAFSMFLFSIGTVPLMFAFGALSSLLTKKFTAKMMSASAVLVIILGIFMFNSGAGLSGLTIPAPVSQAQNSKIATLEDGVQIVTTSIESGRYEPIVVQMGIPVKWTIQAEDSNINGCNNSIIIPKYDLQYDLKAGDNVIEFTPEESGNVPYSCWMGMIRSKITVVEDLSNIDSGKITETPDSNVDNNTSNTTDSGANSDSNNGTGNGISDGNNGLNNLLEPKIPTDQVAIAEVKDGVQQVTIDIDENGFSPAVVVMQKDLETTWNINSKSGNNIKSILFPVYYAQISLKEGENIITLIPDQDFDFLTDDSSFYGYVKVVEDINNIDMDAIISEVEAYDPTIQSIDEEDAVPSCH